MHGANHRPWFVLLVISIVVASCGSPSITPPATSYRSPQSVSSSSSAALEPVPSATPSEAVPSAARPSPAPMPTDPLIGQVLVTVSDNLRIRSEPRVSDDSLKYEPLLPLGTELAVIGGPVSASGYAWYRVRPVSFTLRDGPGDGWVAMAGKNGEPWAVRSDSPLAGIELAQAGVSRARADPAAAETAAASINAFGLDLLRAMLADGTVKPGENAVISPSSIALALAMARAGAKGETASQMDAVLHASGWDQLATGLNALDQALASRNGTWADYDGSPREVSLQVTNAAFAQQGWSLEQEYLKRIGGTFGSGVHLVDFRTDPELARQAINAWVNEQTHNRIPGLLTPSDVTNQTVLYLVNAIYLKAEWEEWFYEAGTASAPFTRLDGSQVSVPMMRRVGASGAGVMPIAYAHGNGWQAVDLRYTHPDGAPPLAMSVILPDDLQGFEASLSASQLRRITAALDSERRAFEEGITCPNSLSFESGCYPYDLNLFMPRFGVDTRADLIPALKAAGMPLAFAFPDADFTGIHAPEGALDRMFVSHVIHQANIDVDEKGTEAAAATAVGGDTGGGPSPLKDITVRLDHPFLFVVRDVETGAVLFMGRVVDPSIGR